MNLLVIDRPDSWHVSDLRRAAEFDQTISTATFEQLSAAIAGDSFGNNQYFVNGQPLEDFDAIFTRAMKSSSLEQIVFRMDWLRQVEHNLQIPVVNPAASIEACIDKYLSLELLSDYDLNVPSTNVSQLAVEATQFFEQSGGDCVVKPIFGSRGRGIRRISSLKEAEILFNDLEAQGSVIYQQRYIEHGDSDIRLLVVGDNVFGMRRSRKGHWVVNASQGADCAPYEANELEREMAITASHSQRAFIAGVDLIYDTSGIPYIVEVNACPSWKFLCQATGIDVSKYLLEFIETMAMTKSF